MAYNTPPSKSPGDTLTAAEWNAYVRDNMAAGAPDLFTAAGDLLVADGANSAVALPSGYQYYLLQSNGLSSSLSWSMTTPNCRLARSTAQSISNNTLTSIVFDTESEDTGGFYPGSGATITLPSVAFGSGLFMISGWGSFDGHATDDTLREIGIKINSSNIGASFVQDTDATATSVFISLPLNLTATTTIELTVLQKSGGSLNFNNANLTIFRVR